MRHIVHSLAPKGEHFSLVKVAVHVYNWVEVAVHCSLVEVAAHVYNCVVTRRAVTRVMSPL